MKIKHNIKAIFLGLNSPIPFEEIISHTVEINFEQDENNHRDMTILSIENNNIGMFVLDPLSLLSMCIGSFRKGYISRDKVEESRGALCIPHDWSEQYNFKNLRIEDSINLNFCFNYSQFFEYDIYLDDKKIEFSYQCSNQNIFKYLDEIKNKYKEFEINEEDDLIDELHKDNENYFNLQKQLEKFKY